MRNAQQFGCNQPELETHGSRWGDASGGITLAEDATAASRWSSGAFLPRIRRVHFVARCPITARADETHSNATAALRHNPIGRFNTHQSADQTNAMSHNATLFEYELGAFALAAGLDRPPPCRLDFADLESCRLDDSLDALDVLGLCAPVLALDTADAMLLPDPMDTCTPSSSNRATPRNSTIRHRSGSVGDAASPKPHRHHCKKASRKQVHELQVMVNAMQVQVNGAAAEIQQLAQLVGQFARQREQEQERFRRLEQQQQFAEQEMDIDLDAQQRHLRAQVEHDREQFECEQQQQYYDL